MDIGKTDETTLKLLHKAFEIVLNQYNVPFKKIGIAEENDQLLFLYEGKSEKVHVFKWSKASTKSLSIGVIAQSVLQPIIPHLRTLQ